MIRLLYCAICWQEFDSPSEHDAASAYKGERLNGHCRGDIRLATPKSRTQIKRMAQKEALPLDSADPIILK